MAIRITSGRSGSSSYLPEFQASIENKQIQAQNALAEKEKVAGEEQKANQAIEQARGRAESVLVEAKKQAEANLELAKSITPEYIQYIFDKNGGAKEQTAKDLGTTPMGQDSALDRMMAGVQR